MTETATKERGILFSAPMVLALLAGAKTQTRRVVKPQPIMPRSLKACMCPHGLIGDRLWVRETWCDRPIIGEKRIHYKADGIGTATKLFEWRSPIHLPRRLSRITLEITDVRVQRLQDITDDEAQAEGIETIHSDMHGCKMFKLYEPDRFWGFSPRDSFHSLWESINGKKYPWASNPWVWAITFKRIVGAA